MLCANAFQASSASMSGAAEAACKTKLFQTGIQLLLNLTGMLLFCKVGGIILLTVRLSGAMTYQTSNKHQTTYQKSMPDAGRQANSPAAALSSGSGVSPRGWHHLAPGNWMQLATLRCISVAKRRVFTHLDTVRSVCSSDSTGLVSKLIPAQGIPRDPKGSQEIPRDPRIQLLGSPLGYAH